MAISKTMEITDKESHEELLRLVKNQLKAVMEESVTKKFIFVESPHVLRLSGTIERCLLDGIKKRPSAFYRNKIAYLFNKVGKALPEVAKVVPKIEAAEAKLDKTTVTKEGRPYRPSSSISGARGSSFSGRKHLWVRMAITEKVIDKIIDYLVANHRNFYGSSSIMADPLRGKILSSLLVGPCALDYTKMKSQNSYWSDPPAEELLQRHKLHSRAPPSPEKRPTLQYSSSLQRSVSECAKHGPAFRDYMESLHQNSKITLLYGKNNVTIELEDVGIVPGYLSLHQEPSRLMIKWTPNQLISGAGPGLDSSLPSKIIHQNGDVPKRNGKNHSAENNEGVWRRQKLVRTYSSDKRSLSSYWEYAVSVDVQEVVYLHCHHQKDASFMLVLIGQDGVQWPPFHFQSGGQLLSFLSSLETALQPQGSFDPPLRSQKGKSKLFPEVEMESSPPPESRKDSHEATDFVFRVTPVQDGNVGNVTSNRTLRRNSERVSPPNFDLMHSVFSLPSLWSKSFSSTGKKPPLSGAMKSGISRSVVIKRDMNSRRYASGSSDVEENYARSKASRNHSSAGGHEPTDGFVPNLDMYTWDRDEQRHYNDAAVPNGTPEKYSKQARSALKTLCDSMRRQIISRAFYGWLAHCRHLTTVRTHLTALVNTRVMSPQSPTDATVGVTEEVWNTLMKEGKLTDIDELSRYVYYGGLKAKHLRRTIWLYLLGYYPVGCSEKERHEIDALAEEEYEKAHLLDAVIKQRVSEMSSEQFLRNGDVFDSDGFSESASNQEYSTSCPQRSQSVISKTLQEMLADIEYEMAEGKNRSPLQFPQEKPRNALQRHQPALHQVRSTPLNLDSSVSMKNLMANEDPIVSTSLDEDSDACSMSSASSIEEATWWTEDENERPGEKGKACNGVKTVPADSSFTNQQFVPSWEPSENPLSTNLSQIDKDVHRCDRNHVYFSQAENLVKLRNVMCCYVWTHPDMAYVQGMCDLAAPLLILFDDESLVFACFNKLMERIPFRKGNLMETRLANLKSLIQILDHELYDHLCQKNDDTYFFFCYRWFLLEFKRELSYEEDVFAVWERTWAARNCSTRDFGLFFGLAMLETYRDIILENKMDFSGIVKFFNEMAEKHDATKLVQLAQKFVADVHHLIET